MMNRPTQDNGVPLMHTATWGQAGWQVVNHSLVR
jgi:hypothetical protein